MDVSFQLIWVNIEEQDCRIAWLEYIQLCEELSQHLPNWGTISHPHQRWTCILLAPYSLQQLADLLGPRGCLTVVLISNFPTTRDAEPLFIRLFAFCVSSLVMCPHFFCPFLIVCFIFLSLNFKRFLCILDTGPLSDTCFAIFSPRLWFDFSFS